LEAGLARYKVAIVGAGPAGYFSAQALQNAETEDRTFAIDLIERLPTPWGLVRSGVAPDHPKIKTVSKAFEKIAAHPNFRLFGNIELGTHISIDELTARYDAVIMCTGSSIGKKLGIPGEDLPGYMSAADFVPWYNGHPDYINVHLPLEPEVAVVIGAGNVAMDCARMLALEPTELDTTDTVEHALAHFHASHIRKIFIVGRRGPEHAAFTSPELRDLPKLEHTDVYMDPIAISEALARAISEAGGEEELAKDTKNNLEAMRLIAVNEKSGHPRSMDFHFLSAPIEIKGNGKVEEVVFGVNAVVDGKIVATGETYSINCGLVISAIGYEALPIDGINFARGRIDNVDGRVLNSNIYTVGWAKRGPSGVIGTNKSDASAVIELIIEDLDAPKVGGDITELLEPDHIVVDQPYWERINAGEIATGEPVGKPRIKAVSREELLGLGRG
jgi:ferredoxin--NADP+ reductase